MSDDRKRSRWMSGIAAMILLLLLYVASYPLVLRWAYPLRGECIIGENIIGYTRDVAHVPLYTPVEWLVDETSAKRPIFWWAQICRAKNTVELARHEREAQRARSRMRVLQGHSP
jgi:hypothetical protein